MLRSPPRHSQGTPADDDLRHPSDPGHRALPRPGGPRRGVRRDPPRRGGPGGGHRGHARRARGRSNGGGIRGAGRGGDDRLGRRRARIRRGRRGLPGEPGREGGGGSGRGRARRPRGAGSPFPDRDRHRGRRRRGRSQALPRGARWARLPAGPPRTVLAGRVRADRRHPSRGRRVVARRRGGLRRARWDARRFDTSIDGSRARVPGRTRSSGRRAGARGPGAETRVTGVPEVVALGETMLSLVAVGVPLAEATELHGTHGGAESNTCIGLVRLGVRAAFVSRLRTDPSGDRIAADLRDAGVDLRWVRRDPDRPTGLMLRETSGAPSRYHRAGSAASALSQADLDGVPVEQARAVLVTGITAMLGEGPRSAALALLERARGLRVVDPNLRPGLWGSDRARELVVPLLERADLICGGEAELERLLGGGGERKLAERCHALGAGEVVLKRGAGGAAVSDGSGGWI